MCKYGRYGIDDLLKMPHTKIIHFRDMILLENKIEKEAYEKANKK